MSNCDMCDESENDYCIKCGEPHGSLRDFLIEEAQDELDNFFFQDLF